MVLYIFTVYSTILRKVYVYTLQHTPGRQSSYRLTAITALSHITVACTRYSTLAVRKVPPSVRHATVIPSVLVCFVFCVTTLLNFLVLGVLRVRVSKVLFQWVLHVIYKTY